MNCLHKTLFQSFVKPFYKENAGTFVFAFTMMFCIVSKVDGAGVYEYHYSLITGMFKSRVFLMIVLFAWFMYLRKCIVFVSKVIFNPRYSFLQVYNQLSPLKNFWLLFIVEIWLLMPVLLYTLFISFIGFKQHHYLTVALIVSYLLFLSVMAAIWHAHQLDNLNKRGIFSFLNFNGKPGQLSSYHFILLQFISKNQIMVWTGIKIFTCGALYLIARNNSLTDYDISMPFLFYNFGILANGVIIFRIRAFEELYLSFYRSLPVSLIKRCLQYLVTYLILLIPEIVTAIALTPVHLYLRDAVNFILCGVGLSLLMNSITFIDFKMKEYLKILLVFFCIECIFLMTVGFVFLYLFLLIAAVIIFFRRYYQFEQNAYSDRLG
jgi:hypothetical protein